MKKNRKGKMFVGMAWYRPNQWSLLRQVSLDSHDLEPTYEEWEKLAATKFQELQAQGVSVEKVDVDVEELIVWCRSRNVPINAAARSNFAAEKVRQKHTGQHE